MNAPVNPLDFTFVKCAPLSELPSGEHRIGMHLPNMLGLHRSEELRLLRKLRREARMPERYPER